MENSENINFDNALESLESSWEILDDFGAQDFSTDPPVNTDGDGEDGNSNIDPADDTSFEDQFTDDSVEDGEDVDDGGESSSDSEDELMSYIGKTLSDKGILQLGSEDKEFKTEDDIYNGIQETITNGIESWKSSLGEESLKYIDYLEKGGDPSKYIEVNAEVDYSTMSLEDDDSKKSLITAFYKEKGFSEKKIQRLIESSEDMDELSDEAEEAKEYFKNKKESSKEALLRAQALEAEKHRKSQEEFTASLETYIKEKEAVRDFPIKTEKQKSEIMSYIFDKNVPFKQPDGTIIKVSQYMLDKFKRSENSESKLEDIIFDALVTKHGSAPIGKKALSDRNRKLADLATQHKRKNTSAKLSGSGDKSRKPRTDSKRISFEDGEWEDI